jgi:hypothetical protein
VIQIVLEPPSRAIWPIPELLSELQPNVVHLGVQNSFWPKKGLENKLRCWECVADMGAVSLKSFIETETSGWMTFNNFAATRSSLIPLALPTYTWRRALLLSVVWRGCTEYGVNCRCSSFGGAMNRRSRWRSAGPMLNSLSCHPGNFANNNSNNQHAHKRSHPRISRNEYYLPPANIRSPLLGQR